MKFKKHILPLIFAVLLVINAVPINALTPEEVMQSSPDSVYVIGGGDEAETLNSFTKVGIDNVKLVDVADMPFTKAISIDAIKTVENDYMRSYQFSLDKPVLSGETVWLRFYIRSRTENSATVNYAVKYLPDYQDWFGYAGTLSVGGEWQEVNAFALVPKTAVAADPNSRAYLDFTFGYGEQYVEIGGISLVNFGRVDTAVVDELSNALYYPGIEEDAPWRAKAEEMIKENRMGSFPITVTDSKGNPVTDADVSVEMQRHSYTFGTAIPAARIVDNEQNAAAREMIFSFLNTITFENDLKWAPYIGESGQYLGKKWAVQAVDDLIAHNIDVVGHVLYWGSWSHAPAYLKDYANNPEQLEAEYNAHITDILNTFKGKIKTWDVVNEAYDNYEITAVLDTDYKNNPVSLLRRYDLAESIDPELRLAYNDYGMFGTNNIVHYDYMKQISKWFVDNDAPIDVIGAQSYFTLGTVKGPEEIWANLDEFYNLTGLPIKFSEYNFKTGARTDEAIKAYQYAYTRDTLTAVFAYPNSEGFIAWTNTGDASANEYAGYFYDDFSLTPIGQAAYDLIRGEWWTVETGSTDKTGAFAFDGFYGDYKIILTKNGVTEEFDFSFLQDGAGAELVFDSGSGFPVWIIIIAAGVVLIVIAALLIYKRKIKKLS